MIRLSAMVTIIATLSLLLPSAAGAGTLPDITGTWYLSGNHAKRCHVEQSGLNVTLSNELGEKGWGTFANPTTLSTTWHEWHAGVGPTIHIVGHISNDLQTIHWSNSTYWTR